MIAVDTSALMAVLLNEPEADACVTALKAADHLLISAGTLAETLIVAQRRNLGDQVERLIDGLGFEVVSVSRASARQMAAAYEQWGKGILAAKLNIGDCFAYALAKSRNCPLLYVGQDFGHTDVAGVLQS